MISKIRDLIGSKTKDSDNYDKKYMKIKFNSFDEFLLNNRIEMSSLMIVVRAIFLEKNKFYPQVF